MKKSISEDVNEQADGQRLGSVATIEEVAQFLKLKPSQVRELLRRRCARPIPCLRAGRHLRFDLQDVSKWLREGNRS